MSKDVEVPRGNSFSFVRLLFCSFVCLLYFGFHKKLRFSPKNLTKSGIYWFILTRSQKMLRCENVSLENLTQPEQDEYLEALERKVHFYFMELGVPLVCAFGLLGNILNLMVLTREKIYYSLTKMEQSAHIGLIALSISDFMFCLLALMFTVLPSKDVYKEANGILYYRWLGSSFITIFIITSTWLIVVMAGERYLAICHPFRARKVISLQKTKVSIILVYVLCVCLTIPLFFETEIKETVCADSSSLFQIKLRTDFGDGFMNIRRLIWAIFFDFLPFVSLLYFNTRLILKIHKAKKIRKEMVPGYHSKNFVPYHATSHSNCMSKTDSEFTQVNHETRMSSLRIKRSYSDNRHQHPKTIPIKKHASRRQLLKSKRRHSDNALNSVTATLVAVVVLFLILVSPSEILKFTYAKFKENSTGAEKYYEIIKHITNFMQALNFSINFVLYCAINKSFRKTLATLFCFCHREPPSTTTINMANSTQCNHYSYKNSTKNS